MTLAWHFAGTQMRDGSRLGAPGEIETYDGPLVMCSQGLHASEKLLDALRYAPGPLLRRVNMGGKILRGTDKLDAETRLVLWECDMTAALRLFARKCALDVAHMWDMPPLVREYLMTGREDIRAAAWDAARGAASAAARGGAWDAAWDAALDAASAAAWGGAWGAARAAALDAASAAAWGGAWDAASAAASAAAWGGAWGAASAAAWDAARAAALDAASAAAGGAARAAQERRLVAYAQAARAGMFHA